MNTINTITIEDIKAIEIRMKRRLARCIKEEAGRDWERLWREERKDYKELINYTPQSTDDQLTLSRLINLHNEIREGVTAMTGKVH